MYIQQHISVADAIRRQVARASALRAPTKAQPSGQVPGIRSHPDYQPRVVNPAAYREHNLASVKQDWQAEPKRIALPH